MSTTTATATPTRHVKVAIIGAGTAGQNAFAQVRKVTDDVVIINDGYWTTTCATVGCMPSKLLIAAAERAHHANDSGAFGVHGQAQIDGKQVMRRVQQERDRFAGFVQDKVDGWDDTFKISGRACIDESRLIRVNDELIHADIVVIATGSTPFIPEGWHKALGDRLLTSDSIFELDDLPESIAVVGAGAIGLELAQAMHRLGVRVTLFNRRHAVGGIQDDKVNQKAIACFEHELDLQLDSTIDGVVNNKTSADKHAIINFTDSDGDTQTWQGQYVLVAAGRRPYLDKLGVAHLGVTLDDKGHPKDHDLRTGQIKTSNVFIIGDANSHLPLLHVASNEGYRTGQAVANLLSKQTDSEKSDPADDADQADGNFDTISEPVTMMAVVFSEPQIASVGKSLAQLDDEGTSYIIGEVSFDDQGRSRVMGVNCGLLRLYVSAEDGQRGHGQLLGANMVAPDAEYIAHILATAISNQLTVDDLLDSPFYHPTILEGLRTALRDAKSKLAS